MNDAEKRLRRFCDLETMDFMQVLEDVEIVLAELDRLRKMNGRLWKKNVEYHEVIKAIRNQYAAEPKRLEDGEDE